MTPEKKARQEIDRQLDQAGWIVQNPSEMNIFAGPGVAIREFPLNSGFADYLLYLDGKAASVARRNKDHIASSLTIGSDDVPFNQLGGLGRVYELFGDSLASILDELNTRLAA